MGKFDDLKNKAIDKGKSFADDQVGDAQDKYLKDKDGVNKHIDKAREKYLDADKKEDNKKEDNKKEEK